MSLYAHNKTASPVTLAGTSVVVPASPNPPFIGPGVNVTSELATLGSSQLQALKRQGGVVYVWSSGVPEFNIRPLVSETERAERARAQKVVQHALDTAVELHRPDHKTDAKVTANKRTTRSGIRKGDDALDLSYIRASALSIHQSVFITDWVIGVEAANAIPVSFQLCGLKHRPIRHRAGRPYVAMFRICDDNDPGTASAVAPDGGIAIAGGGEGIIWESNDLKGQLVTGVGGSVDLTLTHAAGAKTVYLALIMCDGTIVFSDPITWAA